jgi:hypothetical protein
MSASRASRRRFPDVVSVVQPAEARRAANASPTVTLALELDRKFPTKRTRGVIGAEPQNVMTRHEPPEAKSSGHRKGRSHAQRVLSHRSDHHFLSVQQFVSGVTFSHAVTTM